MNEIIETTQPQGSGNVITQLDSVGIQDLNNQVTFDQEGLIEIPTDKAENWTVGDFVDLEIHYQLSANTAVDNRTRVLLLSYDRGLYDEVKRRCELRFSKQTVNQWKTEIGIANILRMHGLPIRCIEAIRSNFGKKNLAKFLKNSDYKKEIGTALVQGGASSKLKQLKQKFTGKTTFLEDIIYSEHTPDRQLEEFVFKLFQKEHPEFVWHHLGKDKKTEMGIDILGEKSTEEKKWKIGIQVKLYQEHSYIAGEDWRDFLAGCTIHKLNEIKLVIKGRLTQKQLHQCQMADITIIHLDQINRMADKHGLPHFEFQ